MAEKNAQAPKKSGGIGAYFKGIRTEMKKVVWPSKKELTSYTGVVIATCLIFAFGIWVVDTAVLAALGAVLQITF